MRPFAWHLATIVYSRMSMRGSRKFCQRESNSDNVCFLVDGELEDPNTTESGTSKWRFAGEPIIIPPLNAALVAL